MLSVRGADVLLDTTADPPRHARAPFLRLQEQLNLIGRDVPVVPTMCALPSGPRDRLPAASPRRRAWSADAVVWTELLLLGLRISLVEEHHGADVAACGQVPAAIVDDDRIPLDLGLILPEPRGAGVGGLYRRAVVIQPLRRDVDRLVLLQDRWLCGSASGAVRRGPAQAPHLLPRADRAGWTELRIRYRPSASSR